MRRPPTPAQLRACVWAVHAVRLARRQLQAGPICELSLPEPPSAGLEATRGVEVALRLCRATCLQSSLIRQSWYAQHGIPQDVVIGVAGAGDAFKAHAWLERPGQLTETAYSEIWRLSTGERASSDRG